MSSPLDRIEACRRALETTCRKSGAWISADGRVGEEVAAGLLGIAPGTLANKRGEGTAPQHYRLPGGGHRVTYGLFDVAVWIESFRSE